MPIRNVTRTPALFKPQIVYDAGGNAGGGNTTQSTHTNSPGGGHLDTVTAGDGHGNLPEAADQGDTRAAQKTAMLTLQEAWLSQGILQSQMVAAIQSLKAGIWPDPSDPTTPWLAQFVSVDPGGSGTFSFNGHKARVALGLSPPAQGETPQAIRFATLPAAPAETQAYADAVASAPVTYYGGSDAPAQAQSVPLPEAASVALTDAQIAAYVAANITDPAQVVATAIAEGVTPARIARATGITLGDVQQYWALGVAGVSSFDPNNPPWLAPADIIPPAPGPYTGPQTSDGGAGVPSPSPSPAPAPSPSPAPGSGPYGLAPLTDADLRNAIIAALPSLQPPITSHQTYLAARQLAMDTWGVPASQVDRVCLTIATIRDYVPDPVTGQTQADSGGGFSWVMGLLGLVSLFGGGGN